MYQLDPAAAAASTAAVAVPAAVVSSPFSAAAAAADASPPSSVGACSHPNAATHRPTGAASYAHLFTPPTPTTLQ